MLARLTRHLELGLATTELSLPQYRTIGFLAEGEEAASRLAEKLAVSPPSVTAMVDGLIARGFVERNPDPSDRRRHQLTLTDAGRSALADADTAVADRMAMLTDYLGAGDAKAARRSVHHWQTALDRYRDVVRQGGRVDRSGVPSR